MPCVGAYEPVLPRPASLPARRGEEAPDRRREVRPLRAGERDGAATSWRVALVLEPLAQQLESAPEPHLHRAFRRVEVGCDIAEGLSVQKPSQHDLPLRRGKVGEGRAERTSELGFGNRSSPVRRQPLLRRLQRDLLTVPATQLVHPSSMGDRQQPGQERTPVALELMLRSCRIRKYPLAELLRLVGIPSPAKQEPIHVAVVAPKRRFDNVLLDPSLVRRAWKVTPQRFDLHPELLGMGRLRAPRYLSKGVRTSKCICVSPG